MYAFLQVTVGEGPAGGDQQAPASGLYKLFELAGQ